MSRAGERGSAVLFLLLLLALAPVLALLPLDPGAVRLAGISLLWWYAAVAAPAVGVVVAAVTLIRSSS